jgi:hypothetical protein
MSQYNIIPLFPRPMRRQKANTNFSAICNNIVEVEQKRYQQAMREAANKLTREDIEDQETPKKIRFQRQLYDVIIKSIDLWFPYLLSVYDLEKNEYNFRGIRAFLDSLYSNKTDAAKLEVVLNWLDDLADMLKVWHNFALHVEEAGDLMHGHTGLDLYEAYFDSQVKIYAALTLFQSETDLNEFCHHTYECLYGLSTVFISDTYDLLMRQLKTIHFRSDFLDDSLHPEIHIVEEIDALMRETSELYMYYLANYLSTLIGGYSTQDLRSQFIGMFKQGTLWQKLDEEAKV